MIRSKLRARAVIPAAILGLMLAAAAVGAQVPPTVPDWAEETALSAAAQQSGLPVEEMAVQNSTAVTLPLTGVLVYNFKIVHELTDSTFDISVDEFGALVDLSALIQAEDDAHDALYGPIDPGLHGQLTAAPGDLFEVEITVDEALTGPTVTRPDPDSVIDEAELDALILQLDAEEDLLVQMAIDPVVTRLQDMGFTVESDDFAPILHAQLPGDFILGDVAGWPEVLAVDPVEIAEDALEIQIPTMQTSVVHNRGITGTGERGAVIEVGGRINTLNPNLAAPRVFQDTVSSCLSGHTAGVAGIVGGSGTTNIARPGHALNANLWIGGSCGGVLRQLRSRSNAAARWGARTFNLSWGIPAGGLRPIGRYYDRMVRNRWRTVVVAAGNSGAAGPVWSPATAYNVLTVGSFDDRNTVPWGDDVMSFFSSGVPPASRWGDRIKPEAAAPGSNLNSTTNAFPWTGAIGSGTSFAAPAVTGVTGLLMQRSLALRVWPESVKAIIMATAQHNIVGAARLSTLDGAGGTVSDRADDVASGVRGGWGGRFYNCASPRLLNLTTFSAQAGQRVRAAIAWDTAPNYRRYRRQPSADLDLWVRGPTGSLVAFSVSWDNTYEIVDFNAPQTGNYTLQVFQWRCNVSPRWLGFGYHR